MRRSMPILLASLFFNLVKGHVAAWHPAMYCLNGTDPNVDNQNANDICNPLFQLLKVDWWFHHIDNCDLFPPDEGNFLELPANGQFTVELAVNRAFTTLSYGGSNVGTLLDGSNDESKFVRSDEGCVVSPNIHAQNESMAAGTAFAISYTSKLEEVTPENLVVFTVRYNTPWRRLVTYDVPNLPACPDDGCICAWGWVANGCGEPNEYMQGFRCKVTGQPGNLALASASPAVWCEEGDDDSQSCTQGAKQMIYWNQLEGNNIEVEGFDRVGSNKSPAYNSKLGFPDGAQHDIFSSSTAPYFPPPPSTSSTPSSASSLHDQSLLKLFSIPRVMKELINDMQVRFY